LGKIESKFKIMSSNIFCVGNLQSSAKKFEISTCSKFLTHTAAGDSPGHSEYQWVLQQPLTHGKHSNLMKELSVMVS